MFSDIKSLEGMIDDKFMAMAQDGADPISKLDMQFAYMEKNKIKIGNSKNVIAFDDQLKIAQQDYRNSLKAKTLEAKQERISRWNQWWVEFFNAMSYSQLNKYTGKTINYSGSYLLNSWMKWHSSQAITPWQAMLTNTRLPYSVKSKGPEYFSYLRDAQDSSSLSDTVRELAYNGKGWPRVYAGLNWGKLERATSWGNAYGMWVLMQNAFPSVAEYEKNPESYYYFIDFMENIPFPTPELMDAAAKKACHFGKDPYTKDSESLLERISDENMNPKSLYIFVFDPPNKNYSAFDGKETTYGMPTLNPSFNGDSILKNPASNSAKPYIKKKFDSVSSWYWPRPRKGYLFIPGVGFILPNKYVPLYFKKQLTPYGFSEFQRIKAEARERARKRRRSASFVQKLGRGLVKLNSRADFWEGMGEVVGGIMHELNPIYQVNRIMRQVPILDDAYRELENLSGGLASQLERVSDLPAKWVRGEPVTEADLMSALDIAIKVVVVVASGGSASAVIGVTSSQLSRGSWGENELGRIFLAVGEIAAVSYAGGTSFTKALGKYAQGQAVSVMKREVYKANPNADIIGAFLIEMSISTGSSIAKGKALDAAFYGNAQKAALISVAKQSPAAALAAMAYSEISKNGIESYLPNWDTVSDPSKWAENFDWSRLGPEFSGMMKKIDSKDAKKLVGLTLMVATGRITGEVALGIIGQQIAIRQIERFYEYKPVGAVSDQDSISFEKNFQAMAKFKNETTLFSKVGGGYIPSVSELETIIDSGSANWVGGKINSAINDDEATNMLWDMQFNIGFPDWAKIGSVDMPEWAKVDKINMPEWSKITGDEEWNKKLNESWDKFKKKLFSRDTLLKFFNGYLLSLWPPGTPLRVPGSDRYNYADYTGFVEVRKNLNFAYDHPMVQTGQIEKQYSDKQKQYILAREIEVKQAETRLAAIQRELGEAGGNPNQLG